MSDQVAPRGDGTEPLRFVDTAQPARRSTIGIVSFSQGRDAGRTGWAQVSISVSATSPTWKSNSRLTVRKAAETNL